MKTAEKDSKGLTGKLAAFAAFLVAVGALVDAVVALGSKSQPLVCSLGISLPWCADRLVSEHLLMGASGWIYVGTRIGPEWKTTEAEGIEPPFTIETKGLPTRGLTYSVIRDVSLREQLPQEEGGRPVMSNSKGIIPAGSRVKLDDIRESKLEKPSRTWV